MIYNKLYTNANKLQFSRDASENLTATKAQYEKAHEEAKRLGKQGWRLLS